MKLLRQLILSPKVVFTFNKDKFCISQLDFIKKLGQLQILFKFHRMQQTTYFQEIHNIT